MNVLYTEGKIGSLTLKNRWIMLAMHTGYADDDGSFGKRDSAFYGKRADGGMAAITLVAAVNKDGAAEGMHRLDDPRFDKGIQEICQTIHEKDCKVIMHLFHAGRNKKIICDDDGRIIYPLAPSDVPSPIYKTIPHVMTEDDIQRTIKDFAIAAKRCKDNGVDCIEVSASAGYLLSEFASALTNKRDDRWGGALRNRFRFPTEVLLAVREAVGPGYPVIVKISGGDMLGGYDLEDMIRFIQNLPKGTVDGVTVTGGWHEAPVPQMTYHVPPAGFARLAEAVKKATDLTVIACNRINSPETAEQVLLNGYADFAGAARPFLADPHFAVKAQNGIPYLPCQACNKGCIERVIKGKDCLCAFNPEAGREYIPKSKGEGQKILVVGGGPVGTSTALFEREKGNDVTLITEEQNLGGKLLIAAKPPGKHRLYEYVKYLNYEIESKNVRIISGKKASVDVIESVAPEKVYFATGAKPKIVNINGSGKMVCRTAEDVLTDEDIGNAKDVVIVGGGSVGLETAEFLATKYPQCKITVLEITDRIGQGLGGLKWIALRNLQERGVAILKNVSIKRCEKNRIYIGQDERTNEIKADMLIWAIGSEPNVEVELEEYLAEHNVQFHVIGDAANAGDIMTGLRQAYELVYDLDLTKTEVENDRKK